MISMGLFTKERKYHVVETKDIAGKVTRRLVPSDEPTRRYEEKIHLEEMEKEYRKKHPKTSGRFVKGLIETGKRVDKAIVNYNRNYNPHRSGSGGGSNYNPFGSFFDTGMEPIKPRRKKTTKKYIVKGGKAYPIARTKKHRKKRKREYDPFDWGW